jgi:hypothetical protein
VERQRAVDADRGQRQAEPGERAEHRHREPGLHTSWPSTSLRVIGRPSGCSASIARTSARRVEQPGRITVAARRQQELRRRRSNTAG